MLKFLLIVVIIYFAVKYLFPILLKFYLKRLQKKYFGDNTQNTKQKKKKDGEITIDSNKKDKEKNDDFGEVIDYEDID